MTTENDSLNILNGQVFDVVRRKYVALTPEEWVRQKVIHHLISDKGCPRGIIGVEMGLNLNGLKRRADVVVHSRDGKPVLVVECKSPEVKLSQDAFDQAGRYNLALNVRYLMITNWEHSYCCRVESGGAYTFIDEVPPYGELCSGEDSH